MKFLSSKPERNVIARPAIAFALLGTLLAVAVPTIAQTIQVNKENRTIAVTATDKVIAIADVATVHIGFIAYGPDNDTAYATGSRTSNAIIKALTDAGVTKDAIESENQNVSPVQPYQIEKLTPAEQEQRQFQVTQSWTVRVPAGDAAKTLDIAVKAGANQSGQIDWSFRDDNAPQAEAAAKALQSARTQAEQMAHSLNAKLGALLYASNQVEASPIRPLMRAMAAAPMAMDKVEPLAINPRQVEKTATVYAVFAIE
jgi:uncharacterized protein YggE